MDSVMDIYMYHSDDDPAKNITPESITLAYVIVSDISISIICMLSIIGSSLIMATHILFKDTRTTARHLLFNLSLADLLTALGNWIGLIINFRQYYDTITKTITNQVVKNICITQAALTIYSTDASILWTIVIACYLFLLIVCRKPLLANNLIPLYYLVSWGIPAVIVIWFSIANFFGLKHESTPGWCSIITTQNVTVGNATQRVNVIYPVIVGYAVFVYLAFVILPVCYITIKCYIRILIKRTLRGEEHSSVEKIVDLKMIFIPLIFIILRIWSLVVDSVKYFSSEGTQHAFSMSVIGQTLILAKGIGDSSQGFANCILFIFLTKSVRIRWWKAISRLFRCKDCHRHMKKMKTINAIAEETGIISDGSAEHGYSTFSSSFHAPSPSNKTD